MRPGAGKGAFVAVAAVGLGAVLVFYAMADPARVPLPRCVFLAATGWQCPGCGSQRALHAALNGDFAGAWAFNRLLPFLAAYAAVLLSGPLWKRRRPGLWAAMTGRTACLSVAAAAVLFTIIRNIT